MHMQINTIPPSQVFNLNKELKTLKEMEQITEDAILNSAKSDVSFDATVDLHKRLFQVKKHIFSVECMLCYYNCETNKKGQFMYEKYCGGD